MIDFASMMHIAEGIVGNVVVAAIILLVGVIIGRFAERLIQFILKQLEVNKVLLKAGIPFALEETISNIVKYAIYFGTIVLTLQQLAITDRVFSIVAGVIIFVVIVSLFLGLKDFIPNYWAGIWLYRKGVYKVGDKILVNGVEGEVVNFSVLETTIKTHAGDLLYLPSSLLLHSQILKKH